VLEKARIKVGVNSETIKKSDTLLLTSEPIVRPDSDEVKCDKVFFFEHPQSDGPILVELNKLNILITLDL
jgi:hypothetical protein